MTEGGHKREAGCGMDIIKRSMALCGSLVLLSSNQSHFHSCWTEKLKVTKLVNHSVASVSMMRLKAM